MRFTSVVLASMMACVSADVTVEGVTFTPEQERRVLDAVNLASFQTLHFTYDVFDYKTDNIINGRYYSSLRQLGRISGVTPFVLRLLRDRVVTCNGGFPTKAMELASTLSFQEVKSLLGVFDDEKAKEVFVERPYCSESDLQQVFATFQIEQLTKMAAQMDRTEGASCSIIEPCATGYLCAGLVSFGPLSGMCRRVWQGGEFTANSDATPSSTVTINVPKFSGGMVATDVVLSVSYDFNEGASLKNIVIEAEDPPGTRVTVWNGPTQGALTSRLPRTFTVPNSQDDTITGNWKIIVSDPSGLATGTLKNIKLVLTARFD